MKVPVFRQEPVRAADTGRFRKKSACRECGDDSPPRKDAHGYWCPRCSSERRCPTCGQWPDYKTRRCACPSEAP